MSPHAKSGAIQALRALAISVVLGFHLDSSFIPNGFLGVDMFFVISGFLMTMILTRSGVTTNSTKNFFQRRIKRIVPLYALTVLLVLCAGRIFLIAKDYRILQTDAVWALGIGSNMQSLFHVYDYFEELTAFKLLTHTWSLAVELQYYLFVPLLMLILLRLPFKIRTFMICLLLAMSWSLQYAMDPSVGFGLLPCRVWQFLCGMIAYNLSQNEKSSDAKKIGFSEVSDSTSLLSEHNSDPLDSSEDLNFERKPRRQGQCYLTVPSLVTHVLFLLLILISFVGSGIAQIDRGIATLLAALLIYFSTYGPTVLLDKWILQYVGDISYILYLSHWPIIVLLKYISVDEKLNIHAMFLAVVLSVAISCVIHHTLEQQFIVNGIKYALIWISILYILSFTLILIPAPDEAEFVVNNNNGTLTNKDCAALTKKLPFPKFETKTVTKNGHEIYGENSGNGTVDVLLIGNSFTRLAIPWIHKAVEGRYRKFATFSTSTCVPFLNHNAIGDRGQAYINCKAALKKELQIACTLRPSIIIMVIGYPQAFRRRFNNEKDTRTLNAIEVLKQYSECSEFIVIDTPTYGIGNLGDKLYKTVQLHSKPLPKNETQYPYADYINRNKAAYQRIETIRRNCPKCHFIDIESEFCDGYTCNTFDYDCGQTYYSADGTHLSNFARSLLFHKYKAEIDIVLSLAEELNKKNRKR